MHLADRAVNILVLGATGLLGNNVGAGRELFAFMRLAASSAEQGASAFTSALETLK